VEAFFNPFFRMTETARNPWNSAEPMDLAGFEAIHPIRGADGRRLPSPGVWGINRHPSCG